MEDGDDISPGEEYEGEFDFITENSAPELVQKVVNEFRTVDADGNVPYVLIEIPQGFYYSSYDFS